jgi:hypothetical protein
MHDCLCYRPSARRGEAMDAPPGNIGIRCVLRPPG